MKKISIFAILLFCVGFMRCQKAPEEATRGVVITSFSPTKAQVHDTIDIVGENFKTTNTNVVYFAGDVVGNVVGNVVEWSPTKLRAVVPDSGVINGPISIRVSLHERAYSTDEFTIDKSNPMILGITPPSGLAGDEILISGANFSDQGNTVMIGGRQAQIKKLGDSIYEREHKILFLVPEGLADGEYEVTVTRQDGVSSEPFDFMIGTVFRDDFKREEDVEWAGPENTKNPLGEHWSIMKGKFAIENTATNGVVHAKEGGFALYQEQGSGISNEGEHSFVVAADIKPQVADGTVYSGLVFNGTDPENYYVARISTVGIVQLLRIKSNEEMGVLLNEGGTKVNQGDIYYRVQVSSDEPGVFRVMVTNTVTQEVCFDQQVIDDDEDLRLNSGFGGLYDGGNTSAYFDNFYISLR